MMMNNNKVYLILLFLLLISKSLSFESSILTFTCDGKIHPESSYNDNFCDCEDGYDEPNTSACSNIINSNTKFQCIGSLSNVTIATSRIGDGICDCCDGSDEIINSFGIMCPDVCASQYLYERQSALNTHSIIQSGIRARVRILDEFLKRKRRDEKSFDALVNERKAIGDLLIEMKIVIMEEEQREDKARFQLLRERQLACAEGVESSCNLFYNGFHNEDELIYFWRGEPRLQPGKRLINSNNEKDIEYLNSLSGLERVRNTICNITYLLPDEGLAVGNVGELIDFVKSPRGKAEKKRRIALAAQSRIDDFLIHGWDGVVYFISIIIEYFSLLISPITLLVRMILSIIDLGFRYLWNTIVYYSTNSNTNFIIRSLCTIISNAYIPDTLTYRLLEYLDYTRYSAAMYVVDATHSINMTPYWVLSIVYSSPKMYLDYYIMGRYKDLPPRRQCCLLREGIIQAKAEMDILKQRITEEEELKADDDDQYKGKGKFKNKKAKTKKTDKKSRYDYGQDDIWESVKGIYF